MRRPLSPLLVITSCLCFSAANAAPSDAVALGQLIFNDTSLSEPAGQACSSCHAPQNGFADHGARISEGAVAGRYGQRNAPTLTYLGDLPPRHYNAEDGTWIGGLFLDGRAESLEQQAAGPLLNPLEMNNASADSLLRKIQQRPYAAELTRLFGPEIWHSGDALLGAVGAALAAFERSPALNSFSSKYDAYLAGTATLSPLEQRGLELFNDEQSANCAACHPSQPQDGQAPLFTDFSYDNLGTPILADHPYYTQTAHNPAGHNWRDRGLALSPFADSEAEAGKFKVPTLRNIALTAPYMHNGVFETLEEVVAFYNRRDVSNRWGEAEISVNVNGDELGDLKLSDADEEALVAFLQTLTDGYQPQQAAR